jgi:hypothetical protein
LPASARRRRVRPGLECLEDRSLPAPLLVTNAADRPGLWSSARWAVNQANQDAQAEVSDTISFSVAQMGTSTVTLLQGQLVLGQNVPALIVGTETIDGGGVVQINGNSQSRVFQVNGFVQAVPTGLTILDGHPQSGIAGGDNGGGIYNGGTLTLNNTAVTGNFAGKPVGIGGIGIGGSIYNAGTLVFNNSTVSNNGAYGSGGIENTAIMTVTGCTVSGNSASLGGVGGIDNAAIMTVTNSTISGNNSFNRTGGINNSGGLTLSNCTISGNYPSGVANVSPAR